MPTIHPLDIRDADPQTAQTLHAVRLQLGKIPNLYATVARAPAVLNAYLQFSETLGKGRLTARQREIIALAVAQANACQYCLSAHTLLGRHAGLSEDEIAAARAGHASTPLDHAIATLTRAIVQSRAQVGLAELQEARDSGIDDGLLIEIVGNVALNILTNYTNHIAGTDVDFPVVCVTPADCQPELA